MSIPYDPDDHQILDETLIQHIHAASLMIEFMALSAFDRACRDVLCLFPHLHSVYQTMSVDFDMSSLTTHVISLSTKGAPMPSGPAALFESYLNSEENEEVEMNKRRLHRLMERVGLGKATRGSGWDRLAHRHSDPPRTISRVGEISLSPRYLLRLTDDERRYLCAHEAMHLYLRHAARGLHLKQEPWQRASDHEVNALLRAAGAPPVPEAATFFPELADRSAESVYQLLVSGEGRERPRPHPGSRRGDLSQPKHEWTPNPCDSSEGTDAVCNPTISHRLDHLRGQVNLPDPQGDPKDQDRSSTAGSAHIERELCRLRDASSARGEVSWRSVLAQFNRSRSQAYSASRVRRRGLHRDLYIPSYRGDAIRLVVALDTSESTIELLPTFLKELEGVLKACPRFELTLIQCAAKVGRVDHFTHKQRQLIGETEVVGGGGTRFTPVFDYIDERSARAPDLLLYFTDGCGPRVERRPRYPVLWVLTENLQIPASFGVALPLLRAQEVAG